MTGWLAPTFAAAAGTALVFQYAAALAGPNACPAAFDLIAVILGRTWRDLPMGSVLAALNAAALFGSLLLFARTLFRITSSFLIAPAITLALAASAGFAGVLAPSTSTVFVLTLAVCVSIGHQRRAIPLTFLSLLAATSAPFAVPVLIAAAWLTRNDGIPRTLLRVGAVMLPLAIVLLVMPLGPSTTRGLHTWACVLPGASLSAWMDAMRSISSMVLESPLAAACAILGLLSLDNLPSYVRRWLVPLCLASVWGEAVGAGHSASSLAPIMIAFWLLVAAGMSEMWQTLRHSRGDALAAVGLSVALVGLQFVSAHRRSPEGHTPDRHDQMTLTMLTSVVGAMPRGAGLIEEDAVTDLLTRALPGRMRSPDRFAVLPRQSDAVTAALARGPVFALPRSQRVLQHLGFEFSATTVPMLVEIRAAHPCSVELGTAPATLEFPPAARGLALVASEDASNDVIVIILAGEAPMAIAPVDWPVASLRGFHPRVFDLTAAPDRQAFAEELQSYGLATWPVPATGYASRIETWRTPGSPLVLPIALGAQVNAGVARATNPTGADRLRICPSLPYDVRPFSPIR